MSKMTAREEKISDFFSDLNKKARLVTFADFDVDDADDADDVFEWYYDHQDYVVGEVIYYSEAMKFLEENDITLRYSIELASDMGYGNSRDNISSETLANAFAFENGDIDFDEDPDGIIGYYEAFHYLWKSDASLTEAFGALVEQGFDRGYKKLNSELLATILKYDMASDEMEKFRSEIEDFFDDLEDED